VLRAITKHLKALISVQLPINMAIVIIADERHKLITVNGQQVDVSHGTQSRAAWNAVRNDPKARSEFINADVWQR